MYCVVSEEGTFYTREKGRIEQYLNKMWLTDAEVYEICDGNIRTYLGKEKTYLNSLAD